MRNVLISSHYPALSFSEEWLTACIIALDSYNAIVVPKGEVSIVFLDGETLQKLHADFCNDPSPTDVITFQGDSAVDFAGEICISVDYALAYAQEHSVDLSEELTLYIVHGWLHLAGFDDLDPVNQVRMEQAEQVLLNYLQQQQRFPKFTLLQTSC